MCLCKSKLMHVFMLESLPACRLTGSLPGSVKGSVSMKGTLTRPHFNTLKVHGFNWKKENCHPLHLVAKQQRMNLQHLYERKYQLYENWKSWEKEYTQYIWNSGKIQSRTERCFFSDTCSWVCEWISQMAQLWPQFQRVFRNPWTPHHHMTSPTSLEQVSCKSWWRHCGTWERL